MKHKVMLFPGKSMDLGVTEQSKIVQTWEEEHIMLHDEFVHVQTQREVYMKLQKGLLGKGIKTREMGLIGGHRMMK